MRAPRHHTRMTIYDVAKILSSAERTGSDTDAPEGARYIMLSDTLANEMAAALMERQWPPTTIS